MYPILFYTIYIITTPINKLKYIHEKIDVRKLTPKEKNSSWSSKEANAIFMDWLILRKKMI